MQYAFIFGRNPDISIAELGAIFGEKKGEMEIVKNRYCAFADDSTAPQISAGAQGPQSPQIFLDRLGGCIEILEIFEKGIFAGAIEEKITGFLLKKFEGKSGKISFAINLVPENKNSRALKHLLPAIKKALRLNGRSANFMNNNFQNVSAVLAVKQNLVKANANISIIDEGEGKFALGFSVALQDFEAYAKRDYGKPFRDPAAGMLPPKLAQIMINLAHVSRSTLHAPCIIIDPFCGTGTILMEALLIGYCVIGSDNNAKMVKGAQKNIAWLRENFCIPESAKSFILTKDACELKGGDLSISTLNPQPSTLLIVTEPSLGPPLSQFPAQPFLDKLISQLSNLYTDFFANAAKWLEKGTPIVFIFPYWKKHGSPPVRLSDHVIAKIESLGYIRTEFAPLKTTSLFYERPGQVVGREIVRFRKK